MSFPAHDTAAALLAPPPPTPAAHSRRADMAISLPTTAAVAAGTTHGAWPAAHEAAGRETMSNKAVTTMSLSATGSKKAPKGVHWSHFLAR